MKRYKAKKTRIPWYMTKVCILVQIVILAFLVHGLMTMASKRSAAVREYNVVHEEYETAQESHDDLGGRVELLGTEYGEESTLRQTFGVVKPQEKVYTIIQPEDHKKKLLPLKEERTWWQNLWYGDED